MGCTYESGVHGMHQSLSYGVKCMGYTGGGSGIPDLLVQYPQVRRGTSQVRRGTSLVRHGTSTSCTTNPPWRPVVVSPWGFRWSVACQVNSAQSPVDSQAVCV